MKLLIKFVFKWSCSMYSDWATGWMDRRIVVRFPVGERDCFAYVRKTNNLNTS